MKKILRELFYPILAIFEKDAELYRTASWKRPVLLIVSLFFIGLAIAVPMVASAYLDSGTWAPTIVFGAIGFTGFIIATLGSDHAVAKLFGGQ